MSAAAISMEKRGPRPATAIPRTSLERGYFQISSDESYLNGWTTTKLRLFLALRDESRGNADFPLPPEFLARSVGGIHPSDVRRLTAELIREGHVRRTWLPDGTGPTYAVRPPSPGVRRAKIPSAVRERFWAVLPRCAHEMHRAVLMWGPASAASLGARVGLSARAAQLGYRLLLDLGAIDGAGKPIAWGKPFDAVLAQPEIAAARAQRRIVPLRAISAPKRRGELAPAAWTNQAPQDGEPEPASDANRVPPPRHSDLITIPRSRTAHSLPGRVSAPANPPEGTRAAASSDQQETAPDHLAALVGRDFARIHGQWLFRGHVLRKFGRLLARGLTGDELDKVARAAAHFPNLPSVQRGSPFDAAFSDARVDPWLEKHRRPRSSASSAPATSHDVANAIPPPPDCLARLREIGLLRSSSSLEPPDPGLAASGAEAAHVDRQRR